MAKHGPSQPFTRNPAPSLEPGVSDAMPPSPAAGDAAPGVPPQHPRPRIISSGHEQPGTSRLPSGVAAHLTESQRLSAEEPLSDADYNYLSRLVYELSRIHLGPNRKELVAARVRKRLRHLRLTSYADYRAYLQSGHAETECQELIDVVSTNFTSFMREPRHFTFLRETILPDWLAAHTRQAGSALNPPGFRAWSAACATGEETYSMAVAMSEVFRNVPHIPWHVEASDISSRVLRWARRGIYEENRLDVVPREWVQRHFEYGVNGWAGHLRVCPHLRSRVTFHHHNLLHPPYPVSGSFDVIFCRNVMIYFDTATQTELVRLLTSHLNPGGWFITGHAETLMAIDHGLERVEPSVYRKPFAPGMQPAAAVRGRKV
ncbi:chemotaxis protein CheR [Verrucomicrobia bacterium LW23]|nr:chemotaxis protein CheR [Verrucomicrobia bacterium LW23]